MKSLYHIAVAQLLIKLYSIWSSIYKPVPYRYNDYTVSKGVSPVYFYSYAKGDSALSGLSKLLSRSYFQEMIPKDQRVAVKLHMGELGNIRYIRPAFVRRVVDLVKGLGGVPFLFDTVASYPGERATKKKYLNTAAMNGFVEASTGAPVVIGDDSDEQEILPITRPVDGCHLKEIKVPALLMKSAGIVVLSHLKGHELAGFGGAIRIWGWAAFLHRPSRHSTR